MEVPAWAAPYIGVPFVEHGRDPSGWDCWGCARWIWAQHFGLEVPSYAETYKTALDVEEIARLLMHTIPQTPWKETVRAEARPGDALLLRVDGLPMHVAVLLTDEVFIHVDRKTATCLDRLSSSRWNRRLLGVYRHGA